LIGSLISKISQEVHPNGTHVTSQDGAGTIEIDRNVNDAVNDFALQPTVTAIGTNHVGNLYYLCSITVKI
jgi:hypothetical protein